MADQPTVGRIVHYTSFGTPGGEYGKECRAAIITEVDDEPGHVGLAVLNPTGMYFNRRLRYDDGSGKPGSPDCADPRSHGDPFRYCACGWTEPSYVGGTWHWPEAEMRVADPEAR
jgi:hypothetical protein